MAPKPESLLKVATALDALANDTQSKKSLKEIARRSELSEATVKRVLAWEREHGPSAHRLDERWQNLRTSEGLNADGSSSKTELNKLTAALKEVTRQRDDLLSYLYEIETFDETDRPIPIRPDRPT